MSRWTKENIDRLISLRKDEGKTWEELSKEHFPGQTPNALRKAFYRYESVDLDIDPFVVKSTSEKKAKQEKAKVLKENSLLIEYLDKRRDLLEEIKDLVKLTTFTKPKIIKPKLDKNKRSMTMETMLTDLHYGKKSKTFNSDVARARMKKFGQVTLAEIDRYSKHYNVERIITFLGGDIIENADFHGVESRRASEFGNSEQVVCAVRSLFEDYVVPIVSTGISCDFICVAGNHCRNSFEPTFQDPGRESLSFIIYNILLDMCKLAGFKNVKFIIPDGVFHVDDIYGSPVLYEHGDRMKGGLNRKGAEAHLSKRSKQVGKLIRFARFGHFHEKTMFGRGRIIFNASLAGQDGYSEILGFDSEASLTINYYIETQNRSDPFYHSFPVCLE